jgi:mitochondrial import receptor subunit TOM20
MNVSVDTVDVPDGNGQTMRKKILVVNKDFKAGEIIYKVRGFICTILSNQRY